MGQINKADQLLLDQIGQGDSLAWQQLLDRYQGRLLAFAKTKLRQSADAEDIVQDTFISFLKSIANFRGQSSIETYLFSILRRKIIDVYRSANHKHMMLLDDMASGDQDSGSGLFQHHASDEMTASRYARNDENKHLHESTLSEAINSLIDDIKQKKNIRDLQIIEMLFYFNWSNQKIAETLDVKVNNVGIIKHRYIQQLRDHLSHLDQSFDLRHINLESLVKTLWLEQRLSCPKRSTIGGYYLETLEKEWMDFVDFHLNQLGCEFCHANLSDIKQKDESKQEQTVFRQRIMESTIGFLRK